MTSSFQSESLPCKPTPPHSLVVRVTHVNSEYNGPQHYEEIPFFGPLEAIQERDLRKQELCRRAGIRLVSVPYWWDEQVASLAATVERAYPGALAAEAARV